MNFYEVSTHIYISWGLAREFKKKLSYVCRYTHSSSTITYCNPPTVRHPSVHSKLVQSSNPLPDS
jgi:hypothetical protein